MIGWIARQLKRIPPPKSKRPVDRPVDRPALSPVEFEAIQIAEAHPVIAPEPVPASLVVVPAWEELEALITTPEQKTIPARYALDYGIMTDAEQAAIHEAPEGWGAIEADDAPSVDRKTLILASLDEAWSQGLRTYAQLIKYVELQTGKGCSKRVVSDWKKVRKLTEVAA